MDLVSMADYKSRSQPNLQHIAPRGTYRRFASLATWNGTRLSEEQALADAIARITSDFEKPRMAVVTGKFESVEPRPMNYWRKRRNAFLRKQLEEVRNARTLS